MKIVRFVVRVALILIVLALIALAISPVYALGLGQAATPATPSVPNIFLIFVEIVVVIAIIYAVAFGVLTGTQIGKGITRWVATKIPGMQWAYVEDFGSYVLALALALIAVFYPGTMIADLLNKIIQVTGVTPDPTLLKILAGILTSLASTALYNSGKVPVAPVVSMPAQERAQLFLPQQAKKA